MSNTIATTTIVVSIIAIALCLSTGPNSQTTIPNSKAFALRLVVDSAKTNDQRLMGMLSLFPGQRSPNAEQSGAMLIVRVSPLDGVIGQCEVSGSDGTILLAGVPRHSVQRMDAK